MVSNCCLLVGHVQLVSNFAQSLCTFRTLIYTIHQGCARGLTRRDQDRDRGVSYRDRGETEAFENFPEARPRPRRSLSEARPRRGVGKASRDQKDLTKYYALDTLFLVRVTYK